jgi:hypothetical protein
MTYKKIYQGSYFAVEFNKDRIVPFGNFLIILDVYDRYLIGRKLFKHLDFPQQNFHGFFMA